MTSVFHLAEGRSATNQKFCLSPPAGLPEANQMQPNTLDPDTGSSDTGIDLHATWELSDENDFSGFDCRHICIHFAVGCL